MSGNRECENFLELIASLLDTYRPEGIITWLGSGNRNFGGYSPKQLIADGDWEPLFAEADRIAGGSR